MHPFVNQTVCLSVCLSVWRTHLCVCDSITQTMNTHLTSVCINHQYLANKHRWRVIGANILPGITSFPDYMGMGLGQGEPQHRACTFPLELPVTMRPPRRSNEATMFNSGWGRRKKKRIIHMSPVNTYRNKHIIMYESIRVILIGTCSLRSRLWSSGPVL